MTTKQLIMTHLVELIKNNSIFTNCEVRINKAGNVTIQAPNSTTRYTIGAMKENESKFWIRGCKMQGWYPSPYRLGMKKVADGNGAWDYHYEYTFNTGAEAYEYFCNFWKKHKLNK